MHSNRTTTKLVRLHFQLLEQLRQGWYKEVVHYTHFFLYEPVILFEPQLKNKYIYINVLKMMDNIANLRLEVLIDYVLTKRNVCTAKINLIGCDIIVN